VVGLSKGTDKMFFIVNYFLLTHSVMLYCSFQAYFHKSFLFVVRKRDKENLDKKYWLLSFHLANSKIATLSFGISLSTFFMLFKLATLTCSKKANLDKATLHCKDIFFNDDDCSVKSPPPVESSTIQVVT